MTLVCRFPLDDQADKSKTKEMVDCENEVEKDLLRAEAEDKEEKL